MKKILFIICILAFVSCLGFCQVVLPSEYSNSFKQGENDEQINELKICRDSFWGCTYLTAGEDISTHNNVVLGKREIIGDPLALRKNQGGRIEKYLAVNFNIKIPENVIINYSELNVEFELTYINNNENNCVLFTICPVVSDIKHMSWENNSVTDISPILSKITSSIDRTKYKYLHNNLYFIIDNDQKLNTGEKIKFTIPKTYFYGYGPSIVSKSINSNGQNIPYDDLCLYDYVFKDSIGNASLGTLRAWVLSQISTLMPDKWSSCVANKDVKLDGNKLTFGLDMHDFNLNVSSKNSYHDVMSIANNTNSLIDFITVNPISSQNYHIKKYEVIDNNLHVWADDICKDPQLVIATGSLTENTKWINLENQQILPDLEEIDGKKYYHLVATLPSTVIDPKVSNNILISVKGVQPNTNGINKHVIIHANTWAEDSIIIKSKSGKWFKLVIDENDQLSIEQVNDSEINNK